MSLNKQLTVLIGLAIILLKFTDTNGLKELTEDQMKLLEEFKLQVTPQIHQDYMKEDVYLIRWLRVGGWDIKRAEAHLISDLKWREENKIDTILDEDWSDFEEHYKYNLYDSKDKEGKPVLYMHISNWDIRRAIVTGQEEKFLRYIDCAYEKTAKYIRELGEKNPNVTQASLIINLAGYNLVQHGCSRCVPIILRALLSYENHYPGYGDKIFLINTPATFEPLMQAVRGLLNEVVDEALKIFGTNKKEWSNALLEVIDANELSISLGGNKVWEGVDDEED